MRLLNDFSGVKPIAWRRYGLDCAGAHDDNAVKGEPRPGFDFERCRPKRNAFVLPSDIANSTNNLETFLNKNINEAAAYAGIASHVALALVGMERFESDPRFFLFPERGVTDCAWRSAL